MFLKKIFLTVAVVLPAVASAQYEAPSDSVSAAAATVIGSYAKAALERQYPADGVAMQQFTDGVKKAFEIEPFDQLYYEGVTQGMKIKDNLEQLRADGYTINDEAFLRGFIAVMQEQSTGFSTDEANAYLTAAQDRARQANAEVQQAFLDAQATREGVVKTPSGLLFEVIREGEGNTPGATDTVEVFYEGKLADGTVFDGTSGQPASLPVNRLIPGFTEGLMMMRPGGTYRLYIPANLGYGERGAGNDIPGGAALEFTVELIGIK